MDITQRAVISIIKSALYNEKTVLPEGFNEKEFKKIVSIHNIWGLAYYGLYNSGIEAPEWLTSKFQIDAALLEILWYNFKELQAKFDENGIEYIPLKGIILKDLYPLPYMRHMSDVDLLIHEEEYQDKIKPLMLSMGYDEGTESEHELHWTKDELTIELHKRIIPSYNKDFYKVIGDGFEWIKDHEYEYIFTHFAKHYRDNGIGIIHLVDIEILKDKAEDNELKALNLVKFHDNVKRTLDCWFRGREFDDVTMKITETIFKSGEYGTLKTGIKSAAVKKVIAANGNAKAARIKDFVKIIFLPYNEMKGRHPILKKMPVLLPFFWVWRIVCSPFRGNVKKNYKSNKAIVTESARYREELNSVGLDYWF